MCSRGGGGLLAERLTLASELWAAGVRAEVVPAASPSATEQFAHAAERARGSWSPWTRRSSRPGNAFVCARSSRERPNQTCHARRLWKSFGRCSSRGEGGTGRPRGCGDERGVANEYSTSPVDFGQHFGSGSAQADESSNSPIPTASIDDPAGGPPRPHTASRPPVKVDEPASSGGCVVRGDDIDRPRDRVHSPRADRGAQEASRGGAQRSGAAEAQGGAVGGERPARCRSPRVAAVSAGRAFARRRRV